MSALFIFGIKGAKEDKISKFLMGRFSVMGGPMDMNFGVFSEIYVRLLKKRISQFFQNIAKVKQSTCQKLLKTMEI